MRFVGHDLRFAYRAMKRSRLANAVAVVSLALAIAGNAVVFSMVDAFFLRPLPYPAPERLVVVAERPKTQPPFSSFVSSLATFGDLSEGSRTVAEWAVVRSKVLALRGTERSEAIPSAQVSANYFDVVGSRVLAGRPFAPEEARPGSDGVALVSEGFAVDRFGTHSEAIGAVLVLDGRPHEIVGVVESSASLLLGLASVWTPLTDRPDSTPRDDRSVLTVGRMADGYTTGDVRAETAAILGRLERSHGETNAGWTADIYNVRDDIPPGQTRSLFLLLQGAVLAVLAIACVNVASLLLALAQARRSEIALRVSLGASRGRVLRQLLTESSLLALGGAGLGLVLAALGIRVVLADLTTLLPPGYELGLDLRVVAFTLSIAALAGMTFGLAPGLQALRNSQVSAIDEGCARGGGAVPKQSGIRYVVMAELALSFVTLGGAGLMVRSFLELRSIEPGFEDATLLTAVVRMPEARFRSEEEHLLFLRRLTERARSVPGIANAAIASSLPLGTAAPTDSFRVEATVAEASAPAPRATVVAASPSFLETLGVELVEGRFLADADEAVPSSSVVVNETLARTHFTVGGAVGRSIRLRGSVRRIVGVVRDVQQSILTSSSRTSSSTVYEPLPRDLPAVRSLVVRTIRTDPRAMSQPLREALEDLDRDLTVSRIMTMDDRVDQALVGVDVFNTILGGFGVLALCLAALGTYGVLSYQVTRRRHEIGVRMALGADRWSVVGAVVREGLTLAAGGLVVGGLLMWPLVRVIQSLLANVSEVRPVTLAFVAVLLLATTAVATFVPAARAARLSPRAVLSGE